MFKHNIRNLVLCFMLSSSAILNIYAQEKGLDSLKRLANTYKQQKKDTLHIKTLIEIAILFSDISLDSTEKYISEVENKLQKIPWRKGNALYHRAKGHYYFRAGLYDKALDEMLLTQKIGQELNDQVLIASTNVRIGTLFNYLKRPKDALNYLEKGSESYKKMGKKTEYGVSLANIGAAHLKNGDFRKAIIYLRQCMKIIEQSNDANALKESRIVAGNNLLAVAYLNAGVPDSSKICENICVQLGEKIKNHHNLYDMYSGFAEYYLKKQNYQLSLQYAQKSLAKAKQLNSIEKQSSVFKLLYENYRINNNLTQSLYYLEKHKQLEDSIQRENVAKQIAVLINTQESEKQKNQIQQLKILNLEQNKNLLYLIIFISFLSVFFFIWTGNRLRNQNKLLISKNVEITTALLRGQTIERQRVAMDLHDNLGSTLSALWLSLESIDKSRMNINEKEILQNLGENLEKAYNDVRLLSHNLLPEEFGKHGLVPTLQSYVRKIGKNSKITFDLQIAQDFGRVDNKIEFELYSICLELVNNIIKHSHASEAKITLTRTEKQIKVIIADNGIGTFNNDSDGKGMKNVKVRVESLNGVWDLKNTENQGTINSIIIPV